MKHFIFAIILLSAASAWSAGSGEEWMGRHQPRYISNTQGENFVCLSAFLAKDSCAICVLFQGASPRPAESPFSQILTDYLSDYLPKGQLLTSNPRVRPVYGPVLDPQLSPDSSGHYSHKVLPGTYSELCKEVVFKAN